MRFRFQTYEFDARDLHVRTLRNKQEYDDPEHEAEALGITSTNWSLFGVVWDSGEVLARLMWEKTFCGEKILEVGCGIALASLALSMRSENISATDRHPDAQRFLSYNSALNALPAIPFERCSWEEPESTLGKFDLIIGSDLLYDRSHVATLTRFIGRHANPGCEVIIVDPNRGLRSKFSACMAQAGFSHDPHTRVVAGAPAGYKGSILTYRS